MIKCENLSIGYGSRVIQHDLSFTLETGQLVALLGANGCGKSTLLRTLAGLQPALGGTYNPEPNEKTVALVLTERLSVESATVRDVVAMGRYPYTSFLGTLSAADHRIVDEAMRQVDVAELADTFYNDHSDGEKQRILIAKALAQQTPVILLDEPTAHLDLPSRIKTLNLLRDIAHEQGKTILISTHELDLALRTADRVLLMFPKNEGALLDTPDKFLHTDAFRRAFGMDVNHFIFPPPPPQKKHPPPALTAYFCASQNFLRQTFAFVGFFLYLCSQIPNHNPSSASGGKEIT